MKAVLLLLKVSQLKRVEVAKLSCSKEADIMIWTLA